MASGRIKSATATSDGRGYEVAVQIACGLGTLMVNITVNVASLTEVPEKTREQIHQLGLDLVAEFQRQGCLG